MPILYSDRLYFTAVDHVVTETKSAFERIMHRTLIGSGKDMGYVRDTT
jgi:hypothetical protein